MARPLAARLLAAQARLVARRPLAVVAVGLLLTLGAGCLASSRLAMKTARLELVGHEAPFVARYLELEREFGDLDSLVVVLRGPDREGVQRFAEALGARVRADQEHFRGIFYRVDPAAFGGRGLLYLPAEDLERLSAAAARLAPHLADGAPLPGVLEAFAAELRRRAAEGAAVEAGDAADEARDEAWGRLTERFLEDVAGALAGEAAAETPVAEALTWGADEGWAWAGDERTLVALVAAREAEGELDPKSAAVRELRALVAELQGDAPEVEVGLTGKPVLQVDEMRTYEADSLRATVVALGGVTLLLVVAFRRLLAPALIGVCLLLAVILTLGGAALWPGHLNLLAVVFVVVVIGLGVDFGIHVVARYDEELRARRPPDEALEAAFAGTGAAVLAGAATTTAAFAACLLTDFKGLREFGAIASMGVAASLLVMTTVLPALVLLLDRLKVRRHGAFVLPRVLRRFDIAHARWPGRVLLAGAVVTAGAAALAARVPYHANLIELQDPSLPSVQLELELLRDQRMTSWFLAWHTPDLEALAATAARVAQVPGVDRTESALSRLPADQEAKLPHLARLQGAVELVAVSRPPLEASALAAGLDDLADALEAAQEQALFAGRDDALAALERLYGRADAAREALAAGGLSEEVQAYDRQLGEDLAALVGRLAVGEVRPLRPADLPPGLRDRLVGRTGSYLLRIYPEGNMWDDRQLAAFVDAVRAELPEVTGVPVLVLESSRLMVGGYQEAGLLALLAVTTCLLLLFRRLGATLLALLALAVGALWMLGLVALVGGDLNPANLVALPLLLGIGIDTAVHVIHRAREVTNEPLLSGSLGRALVYSSLTSVAGFGSLLVSNHQGTASIGLVISLGVLACLLVALSLVPALLVWVGRRG